MTDRHTDPTDDLPLAESPRLGERITLLERVAEGVFELWRAERDGLPCSARTRRTTDSEETPPDWETVPKGHGGVLERGASETHLYVLEWPNAGLRADELADGSLDGGALVALAQGAAAALAELHREGARHGVLSAREILVSDDGEVALDGLGWTPWVTRFGSDAAAFGPAITHVAPELVGGVESTPSSDVFSLGVTLYTLLTGRPPYQGRTPVATRLLASMGRRPKLVEARADLPAALVDLVEAMIHPRADGRPSLDVVRDRLADLPANVNALRAAVDTSRSPPVEAGATLETSGVVGFGAMEPDPRDPGLPPVTELIPTRVPIASWELDKTAPTSTMDAVSMAALVAPTGWEELKATVTTPSAPLPIDELAEPLDDGGGHAFPAEWEQAAPTALDLSSAAKAAIATLESPEPTSVSAWPVDEELGLHPEPTMPWNDVDAMMGPTPVPLAWQTPHSTDSCRPTSTRARSRVPLSWIALGVAGLLCPPLATALTVWACL